MTKIEEAIKAQHAYCEEHKQPEFAPSNGRCWRCGRNIYEGRFAITVEAAASHLISGCPYCNRSFCE